jgi:hypothetical protein
MSIEDLSAEEFKQIMSGECGSCGTPIDASFLRGKARKDYLNYRYDGGGDCFYCNQGDAKILPFPERNMNSAEWLKGTHPVEDIREDSTRRGQAVLGKTLLMYLYKGDMADLMKRQGHRNI